MPDSSAIVQKVWNYAHVLKNAGVGYGDYLPALLRTAMQAGVEVRAAPAFITYLLFGSGLRPPGCAQPFGLPLSASLRVSSSPLLR